MNHIFERSGVMFDVQYIEDTDGVPVFKSVRALGNDYKPEGPNMVQFFDDTLVLVGVAEALPLLAMISEELPNAHV